MSLPAVSAARFDGRRRAPGPLPRRVLMTVDAVGGVWRYAMDLAAAMRDCGVEPLDRRPRPQPSPEQRARGKRHRPARMDGSSRSTGCRRRERARPRAAPPVRIALRHSVDLLHFNLPSQAARMTAELPLVNHVAFLRASWFAAVRGSGLPEAWAWQKRLNRLGFDRADLVLAAEPKPCRDPDAHLRAIPDLAVVYNASRNACSVSTRKLRLCRRSLVGRRQERRRARQGRRRHRLAGRDGPAPAKALTGSTWRSCMPITKVNSATTGHEA